MITSILGYGPGYVSETQVTDPDPRKVMDPCIFGSTTLSATQLISVICIDIGGSIIESKNSIRLKNKTSFFLS
jgi:hypothetical protein